MSDGNYINSSDMKEIDDLNNSWWKESPYELKATVQQIKFNQLESPQDIMTDDDDEDEEKIVNLRGIAIVTTFIISGIILYLQTSEWQANGP